MPVRQLKITGQGSHRRLTDSARPVGSGSMVIKKGLTPLRFKF